MKGGAEKEEELSEGRTTSTSSDLKTSLLRSGTSNARVGESDALVCMGDKVYMSNVSLESNETADAKSQDGGTILSKFGENGGNVNNAFLHDDSQHLSPSLASPSSLRSHDHSMRSYNAYRIGGNERFRRGTLDHLDDEQLGQLVDRLARGDERHDEVPDNELMSIVLGGHGQVDAASSASFGDSA